MEKLIVGKGVKTYQINDDCEIAIRPTDPVFVEKIFSVFDTLDQKQEAYTSQIQDAQPREIFAIARRMDAEIRELVNAVFDFDVCTAVFGEGSVCALSDGVPLWANLMLAIMDVVDGSFASEQKLTAPKLDKYTARYGKGK